MAKIYKQILRFLEWLLLTALLLVITLYLMVQVPAVQQEIVQFAIKQIESISGHDINIKKISIDWFDEATVEKVELYDFEGNLMFEADEVFVDFDIKELLGGEKIGFQEVEIANPGLYLKRYNDSTQINISEFINAISRPKTKNKQKETFIRIGHVNLAGFNFKLDDIRKEKMPARNLDYNHLNLDIPELDVTDFTFIGDSLSIAIGEFSAQDSASGFRIRKLTSQFSFDQENMLLDDLSLETENSKISEKIHFKFSDPSQLSNFVDSVTLDLNLVETELGPADLAYFAEIGSLSEKFRIEAQVQGTISRLTLDEFEIGAGQGSYVQGRANLVGLPVIENTFIDLSLKDSRLLQKDLFRYIEGHSIRTGDISFSGNLLGFVSDFVADGKFKTRHGTIISDLNLKNVSKPTQASYKGNLQLKKFNVGGLINNQNVGVVNFEGSVNGKGLTGKTANVYMSARLKKSYFIQNQFEEINAKGTFASQFFSGEFFVRDSLIDMVGAADIDFKSEEEVIKFGAQIKHADLFALGLYDQPMKISATASADIRNIDLDKARGSIEIDSLVVEQEEKRSYVEKIRLVAIRLNEQQKLYELQASGLNAKLKGDFRLTDLLEEMPGTFQEYRDFFTKQSSEIKSYYRKSQADTNRHFKAQFDIHAIKVNPYLEMLNVPVEISENSLVEGSFTNRNSVNFSLFADIDTIKWSDNVLIDNEIDINASKDNDSTGVLAVVIVNSKNQEWDAISPTNGFESEAVWYNNNIDLTFSIDQPETQTKAYVSSAIKFLTDTIQFNFKKSRLQIFENEWRIDRSNLVNFTQNKILIDDLEFYQEDQTLAVNGVYSDSTATKLDIRITDFLLENVSIVLPSEFDGKLNSKGSITRTKKGEPLRFETEVDIEDLVYEGYRVGNLSGSTDWDTDIEGLNIDMLIKRDEIETINVSGTFLPQNVENQLNIEASIDQANLVLLEPIFSSLTSDLGGTASGKFNLSGSLQAPVLTGKAEVRRGQMRFVYLNTFYNFSGPIVFTKNAIQFKELLLLDRFNDQAVLRGEVRHQGFKEFELDLKMKYTDFELLNTNEKNNSLYYGTAYATGDLIVKGPVNDIYINANATTGPNTKLYVPIAESSEVGQSTFIDFVNFEEEKKDSVTTSGVNLSGISLNFDIDVTDDAYIELIFDPRTGDIIRGSGNGNIQMSISSSGDFELFGGIEITSGAYNFTTSFINKEFQIKEGGTINWYGTPYEGVLDIEATYRQIADLQDYYPEDQQTQAIKEAAKQPVLVVLSLEGSMLNPTINFSVELAEDVSNPEWTRTVQSINAESNTEELKRQVFSLLILRRFSNRQSFTVGGNTGLNSVGSSVSEFVSNQLSYWLNQVDENLEVSIDLASLDNEAFNTFQLRLGYSFFDGRLRVTRWGTVAEEDNATANSIVGNWQVEYLLTEDGRLRVKVFRRAQQITNRLEGDQETGISLQFIRSFDQLSELLTKEREKAIRREENEEEID